MSSVKKSLKWNATHPVRRQDNIQSSKARERGERGFMPSYAHEKKESMNFIMSNEYMRKWFAERDHYQRELYIKQQTQTEEKSIRRRYVQKMLTREKREKVLPIIQLKRFQNIPSKSDNRRDDESKKLKDVSKDGQPKSDVTEKEKKDVEAKKKAKVAKPTDTPVYQRYKPECLPNRKKKNDTSNSDEESKIEKDETSGQVIVSIDDKDAMEVGLMMKPCGCVCGCNRNGLAPSI